MHSFGVMAANALSLKRQEKFGMRYNAYHLTKNAREAPPMRYGDKSMGDKTDDAQGRRLIEVHRASPYEFCLTAEPCLVTNVQAAMSGVVSPQSVAEPTQMFQMFQSLTLPSQ